MNAKDFRIGNYIYYHIEDRMDERREWDELSQIDYDDLRCLTTYEDNSEYRPIPLSEEWLRKFGYIPKDYGWQGKYHYINEFTSNVFTCDKTGRNIKYVNQLQNLYWCLCGEELILKT